MTEIRAWLISLILIGLSWAGLYAMAASATQIPADEPPGAFGVGPMYLLGLAFPLALLSGAWMLAASIRALVVLAGLARRTLMRTGGQTYPASDRSGRGSP